MMIRMLSGFGTHPRPAVGRARWTALVLAVLAGLLAMHALSPVGTPAAGAHSAMLLSGTGAHSAMPPSGTGGHHAPAAAAHGTGTCRHLSDPDTGGAGMHHTGGTCAAGAVSTGYAPPALPPAPPGTAAPDAAHTVPTTLSTTGRAPPDLAELQLLRI
jgi:hypothetical protein